MATITAHFSPPKIYDNPDGWGPNQIPEHFKDIPYAPFSKGDKLGKAADWSGQNQYQRAGQARFSNQYGAGVSTVFSYVHNEEEDSFQMVENKPTKPRFQANRRFVRGGGTQRNFQHPGQKQGANRQTSTGKTGANKQATNPQKRWPNTSRRWGAQYEQTKRPRDWSIDVRPEWTPLETIEFTTLSKLSSDVGEPQDISSCGTLEYYNKAFDRVNTKAEKPLERIDRVFYKVTTTDDPVIQKLVMEEAGNVFATDAILSLLMAAPRSSYSWDIVVTRVGSKLFFDKRDNSQFDFLSVNETANEPPFDDSKDPINSPQSLSQEATFINQNFSQQVLSKEKKFKFDQPNPFQSPGEEPASIAFRYRKWKIGNNTLVARCEVDGVKQGDDGKDQFLTIKALNEYDPKITGVDWRQKLDSQRGAVLATELKNNTAKLARWTAQALLAGSGALCLGYVSRVNPKDPYNHSILSTQFYKPKEFATQITLNVKNMWGILKHIVEICMKLKEGKYILVKDPNKTQITLYEVPHDAFEDSPDEEGELKGTNSGADDQEGTETSTGASS